MLIKPQPPRVQIPVSMKSGLEGRNNLVCAFSIMMLVTVSQ